MTHSRVKHINIVPKCGIELRNKAFWVPYHGHRFHEFRPFDGNKTKFCEYLYENHGIVCWNRHPLANTRYTTEWYDDWKTIIGLLWTV